MSKVLLNFLTPSAANEYTFLNLFHFEKETCQHDLNLDMCSLDIDSLFTNIPLDEAINICIESLCNGNKNPPNFPKYRFRHLLNIASKRLRLTTNIISK